MKILNLLGLMAALSFGAFTVAQADSNPSCCQIGDKTECCMKACCKK